MIRKNVKGTLTDALIILTLIAVLTTSVWFFRALLYNNENLSFHLSVTTEPLDKKHYGAISVGDGMVDNVSKRLVGSVRSVKTEWIDEKTFVCHLVIDAKRIPKGTALRNESVWFFYTAVSEIKRQ